MRGSLQAGTVILPLENECLWCGEFPCIRSVLSCLFSSVSRFLPFIFQTHKLFPANALISRCFVIQPKHVIAVVVFISVYLDLKISFKTFQLYNVLLRKLKYRKGIKCETALFKISTSIDPALHTSVRK